MPDCPCLSERPADCLIHNPPGVMKGELDALAVYRARQRCPERHWTNVDLTALFCLGVIVGGLLFFLLALVVVIPS